MLTLGLFARFFLTISCYFSAPSVIPIPVIPGEGQGTHQRKFTLLLADESNGPIRLFIYLI